MLNSLCTTQLEYWDEAPHDWQKLISQQLQNGRHQIQVPILWGVHETTPGMRDFSKQSKLRIERLFSAAQASGVSIKLILGFPPHPLTFPDWVKETERFEWVPRAIWRGEPPYFSMSKVPSPRSQKLKAHFFSFLEELTSIASLYLSPGGPINEVEFCLHPVQFSQAICDGPEYVNYLQRRYPDVSTFNKRFQTLFKTLSSLATPTGSKLAESKRPWMFAFDYAWVREQIVIEYFRDLLDCKIPENIKKIIKLNTDSPNALNRGNEAAVVYFESTLIQMDQFNGMSPLMIGGQTSPSAVQAFQWAQLVSESCQESGLDLLPLSLQTKTSTSSYTRGMVFCGKYLAKSSCEELQTKLSVGASLFFPMGLPQFDENLESTEFAQVGSKKVLVLGGVEWFCARKGEGQIFFPIQSNAFSCPDLVRDWIKNFGQLELQINNG